MKDKKEFLTKLAICCVVIPAALVRIFLILFSIVFVVWAFKLAPIAVCVSVLLLALISCYIWGKEYLSDDDDYS